MYFSFNTVKKKALKIGKIIFQWINFIKGRYLYMIGFKKIKCPKCREKINKDVINCNQCGCNIHACNGTVYLEKSAKRTFSKRLKDYLDRKMDQPW